MRFPLRITSSALFALLLLFTQTIDAQKVKRAVPVQPQPAPTVPLQQAVDIDSLARFLAGIEPPSGSPLFPLTGTVEWAAYSSSMDQRWQRFDASRLQPVRSWGSSQLGGLPASTVFYPFSGPDFVYAQALFPHAGTYILCGLEPVGAVPSLKNIQPLGPTLAWLQSSIKTLMQAGYFVTKDMRTDFKKGALPILCVMLARSGDRIVSINSDGGHAEIHFSAPGGGEQTLLYFSADLRANGSSVEKFIRQRRPDVAYIKAASYLLHEPQFSAIRNLILAQCNAIVQDDSGIPLRYFDTRQWNLRLYGSYTAPLDIFRKYYQPDMADLYARTTTTPLTFGAGYHWDPRTANLLLAARK